MTEMINGEYTLGQCVTKLNRSPRIGGFAGVTADQVRAAESEGILPLIGHRLAVTIPFITGHRVSIHCTHQ